MESGVPLQLAANQPHPTGAEEMSSHRAPGPGPTAGMAPSGSALPPFNDPMRAYRACLHCRSRKTKCNLDANGGRPVGNNFIDLSCFHFDSNLLVLIYPSCDLPDLCTTQLTLLALSSLSSRRP